MSFHHLTVPRNSPSEKYGPTFYHATTGEASEAATYFILTVEEEALRINFRCENNAFTTSNTYKTDNEPLYNQEVFEIFISAGNEDPTEYLEVEINPNGAVWAGRISNPDALNEPISLLEMLDTSVFRRRVNVSDDVWEGYVEIPWGLISEPDEKNFRANFYRIRSLQAQNTDSHWLGNKENCEYLCFNATLSGDEPAFHRPASFVFLKIA